MKLFPYKWYLGYWFTWLILTVVYFVFFFINEDITKLSSTIGLFVPIGPFSMYAMLNAPITGLLFIFTFLLADKFAFKYMGIKRSFTKITFNLYVLLFVTCFVDTIGFGSWLSLMLIFNQSPVGEEDKFNLFLQQYHIPVITNVVLLSALAIIAITLVRNMIKFKTFSISTDNS